MTAPFGATSQRARFSSIIAGLFSRLSTRLFGKRRALPLAIAGIIIYTILVGGSAAVVRAATMSCLYFIATHYGRQTDALTSLAAAGVLMTLRNPQPLWNLGFQLSSAATLGLIVYVPLLQSWFERLLSKALSPGTAARVVETMNEALIATLLGLVWVPMGQVVGWVAWLVLTYTVRVVEITARIPFAAIDIERPSLMVIWLYYGLLLCWLAWRGGWLKSMGLVKPADSG